MSAPKLRALLAVLLLRRGQVVSAGLLVDELWGDDPPLAARKLVSGYVLRLRRLTGDPDGRVLVTSARGTGCWWPGVRWTWHGSRSW